MSTVFSEAAKLWPKISPYRKLAAAVVGTTGPLLIFLVSEPRAAEEIIAAVYSWLLTNLGVYGVSNANN